MSIEVDKIILNVINEDILLFFDNVFIEINN